MKTSLTLFGTNKFSKPINQAKKTAGQFSEEIKRTNITLKKLGSDNRLVSNFKKQSSQLKDTRQQLANAKSETEQLKVSKTHAAKATKALEVSLEKAEYALLKSAEAHGHQSEQVKSARIEVQRLTKLRTSSEQDLKKEQAALKRSVKNTDRLTQSFKNQSKKLGGLKKELSDAGLNVNALGAEELRLAKKTETANRALDQQKEKLKSIQTIESRIDKRNAQKSELMGEAVSTAAKAAPLVMLGKRSVGYESTFADVKKVINFSSDEEKQTYRSQMLKMAGRLGGENSQDGLADIITAAGQSVIEKYQLLVFAERAKKTAVAWDIDAEKSGETMATWRAAMGLSQTEANDLADATNHLSNNMNAKAKDIAATVTRQGATAMGAGFNYNQTAALSASLIAGGATEDVAATALKNISGRLTAGYAATSAQKKAFSKIGFDPQDLAKSMQSDAQGTLIDVLRALQDVSSDERGAVVSQIFGEEIRGAVVKLVTTLDDDKNGLISAFKKANDDKARAGSVDKEYANRSDTRGHKLSQLRAKFDRMVILLGDRLLPVIDALAPPLMTVVDAIGDFAESSPNLTSALLGVAGAFVAVKAGAIAFKLAKLTLGNGVDHLKLGKAKLTNTTDQTTVSANRAAGALSRVNGALDRLSRTRNAGRYQKDNYRRGRKRNSYQKPQSRLGRLTSGISDLIGGGLLPDFVQTSSNNDTPRRKGRLSGLRSGFAAMSASPMLSGAASIGTKYVAPLAIAAQSVGLISSVAGGDAKEIGQSAGSFAGSTGGMAMGAAIGSAILPGLGTVIGAGLGGFAGSEMGGWLGKTVGSWFTSEKTTDKQTVTKDSKLSTLTNQATTSTAVTAGQYKEKSSKESAQPSEKQTVSTVATLTNSVEKIESNSLVAAGKEKESSHLLSSTIVGFAGSEMGGWLGKTVGSWFTSEKTTDKQTVTKDSKLSTLTNQVTSKDAITANQYKEKSSKESAQSSEKKTVSTATTLTNSVEKIESNSLAAISKEKESSHLLSSSIVGVGGMGMGAAIGSAILPGLGDSIGWLADFVSKSFAVDKTSQVPADSIAAISNGINQQNRQIEDRRSFTFAPVINITPSGNSSYDNSLAENLIERMKAELMPSFIGSYDVSIRADGALTDKGDN